MGCKGQFWVMLELSGLTVSLTLGDRGSNFVCWGRRNGVMFDVASVLDLIPGGVTDVR